MLIEQVRLQSGGVRLELACKSCKHELTYYSAIEVPTPEMVQAMECPECGKVGG